MSTAGGPVVPLFTTRGAAAAQCVYPALVSLLRDRGGDRAINCLAALGGQGFGKSTLLTALALLVEGREVSDAAAAASLLFPRGDTAEHKTVTCDVWTPLHSAGAVPNAAVPCLIDNKGDLKDDAEEDLRKLVLILAAMGPAARMVYVVNDSVNRPIMQALEATAALYARLFTDDADADEPATVATATPAGPRLTLRLFVRTNRTQAINPKDRERLESLFDDFGVFTCANVEGDPLDHDGYMAAVGAVLEWWQGAAALDRLPSCTSFAAMLEEMKCDTGVIQPVPTLIDALVLPGLKARVQASVDTLVAERQVGSAAEREVAGAAAAAAVRAAEAGPSLARLSQAGLEQWAKYHEAVLTVASARWDAALVQAQQQYTATMTTKLSSASDVILKSGAFKGDGDAKWAKAQLEKEAEALAGAPELGALLTEAQRSAWRSHIVDTIVNPAFAAATDKVAKHKAEERRKYDASVVNTATETREREVGKETVPLFRQRDETTRAREDVATQQDVVSELERKLQRARDAASSESERDPAALEKERVAHAAKRATVQDRLQTLQQRAETGKQPSAAKQKTSEKAAKPTETAKQATSEKAAKPTATAKQTTSKTATKPTEKAKLQARLRQLDASLARALKEAERPAALRSEVESLDFQLKQAREQLKTQQKRYSELQNCPIQHGTRVTRTLVRERRTTTTLGSGAVNHGNWVELQRWTTVN